MIKSIPFAPENTIFVRNITYSEVMSMRLGIDFGTTNSGAAVFDGEKLHPIIISAPKPSQILPSLIYVDRQHQAKLGLEAAAEYARRETGRAVRWRSRKAGVIQYWVASTG